MVCVNPAIFDNLQLLQNIGSGGIEKSHSCKWAKWIQWHALPHIQQSTQQRNKGYYPNLHGWDFSIPPSPKYSHDLQGYRFCLRVPFVNPEICLNNHKTKITFCTTFRKRVLQVQGVTCPRIRPPNSLLTANNWQKWKRVFLTCPCHKIYRDEAVGLKSCKYTRKITIFVKMWNLGQNHENLIFCQ